MSTFLIFFVLVWICIIAGNYLLSRFFNPYINFIKKYDVKIRPFFVSFGTSYYNHSFDKFVNCHRLLIRYWFTIGSIVTIIFIPISFFIVFKSLINLLLSKNDVLGYTLQPCVPGLNVPFSDIIYYIISLIITVVIHEFGHFLASISEKVEIREVGFLILFMFPAAFVNLSLEQLLKVSPLTRLRITSAGVWHNIALGLILAVYLLINPYLMKPFYETSQGAIVASIQTSNTLGLKKGDIIQSINENCIVLNKLDWRNCLNALAKYPIEGYCVSQEFIDSEQYHSLDGKCCSDDLQSNICFQNIASQINHCLPVRMLFHTFKKTCNTTEDCNDLNCLKPVEDKTGFRFVRIGRLEGPSIIFWGFPNKLFQETVLIDYKPKYFWLPVLLIYHLETLSKYVISFSFALALCNIIPCVFFDGKWILQCLIQLTLSNYLSIRKMNCLENVFITLGNVLILILIILSLKNLV